MCKTFIVADADDHKSLFKYRSRSPFICRAHALTIGVSDDGKEIVMEKKDMRKEIAEAVTAADRQGCICQKQPDGGYGTCLAAVCSVRS